MAGLSALASIRSLTMAGLAAMASSLAAASASFLAALASSLASRRRGPREGRVRLERQGEAS
jgi:hypothetical protein